VWLALLICLGNPFVEHIVAVNTAFGASAVQEPLFTINISGEHYPVDFKSIQGGWWNAASQRRHYRERSIAERANDTSVKTFATDFADIWAFINDIRKRVEVAPFDGVVEFNTYADTGDTERFTVRGQRSGMDLDEDRLVSDIIAVLQNLDTKRGCEIVAHIKTVQPKPAGEILKNITVRGGYTTYFEQNAPRENNIALALSKFNGLVVKNGQTVSFNKTVGARTRENGFEEAKIILDGEFVPGVGGGVCQASTTIFNAAVLAGLDIEKSHNHSLLISYVPIGRDAMVSSSADLVFTNRTGGTVYFETDVTFAGENGNGQAVVKIYGNKTAVKYKPRTTVTEMDIQKGEIDPARNAVTYVDVLKGETVVNTKLIRRSHYSAVKEKVRDEKIEIQNQTVLPITDGSIMDDKTAPHAPSIVPHN
jgi:vancomycin resistance protein YoaR